LLLAVERQDAPWTGNTQLGTHAFTTEHKPCTGACWLPAGRTHSGKCNTLCVERLHKDACSSLGSRWGGWMVTAAVPCPTAANSTLGRHNTGRLRDLQNNTRVHIASETSKRKRQVPRAWPTTTAALRMRPHTLVSEVNYAWSCLLYPETLVASATAERPPERPPPTATQH
jgi:hypothetical protein